MIDPRDTRTMIAMSLSACYNNKVERHQGVRHMAHVSRRMRRDHADSRLLVANRGEIARRIMRTAREMGIATVAVYADGDADAPFVHEADIAHRARRPHRDRDAISISRKVLDAASAAAPMPCIPATASCRRTPRSRRP